MSDAATAMLLLQCEQAIATGWSDQEGVLKVMRATAFLQRAYAHRRALTALTDRSVLYYIALCCTALHCSVSAQKSI
jgi:hypothetical protein